MRVQLYNQLIAVSLMKLTDRYFAGIHCTVKDLNNTIAKLEKKNAIKALLDACPTTTPANFSRTTTMAESMKQWKHVTIGVRYSIQVIKYVQQYFTKWYFANRKKAQYIADDEIDTFEESRGQPGDWKDCTKAKHTVFHRLAFHHLQSWPADSIAVAMNTTLSSD